MSAFQRVGLSIVVVVIIAFGLVLVGLNWPRVGEITYVECSPHAGECVTYTRTYKIGSEGAVFFGMFLIAFGLIVLGILLMHYVRLMFSMVLRRLKGVKLL